ncbi:dolichol monophosphate mannose synthase [Methylobacterium sp. Leaf399]|uniref:glycosyltransferase n=1 Tax=unclassified Methylobacterium TaxID=2615210 RepID=UPI0007018D81|nr:MULTISPECIES: glycosyltransferase family 2 protein [unclassified Methylobacterium]KQP48969.1 dolichol monophosphate mannose synthase [Methylobacterium sp. Leaf108]KQT18853.1 dolichol monophosphate mannose synthase [Methylobacterium sp. Leaf399]
MLQAPIVADRMVGVHAPIALAVVIPTRNEAGNVVSLLASLDAVLDGLVWEAIFVDDDSQDGTARLIREIGRTNLRVRVLQRVGRQGLASAVIEGMLATSAPVLAVIDADHQHDETLLPRLYAAVAEDGHDLAVGSRHAAGGGLGDWSSERRAASGLATALAHRLLATPLSDPMSGYFVIARGAFEEALPRLSGIGFKILLDIVASAPRPLRVVELPYVFRNRTVGESKLDLMVATEYLTLLLEKTVGRLVPVRLILFLMVGGLGLGVHLGVLGLVLATGLAAFVVAQGLAVGAAMTFNYALNNVFTYRDRRRRGWAFVTGLLSFYAVCLVGAAANVGVGSLIYEADQSWWLSGVAGAVIGSVWNFAASSVVTWRK